MSQLPRPTRQEGRRALMIQLTMDLYDRITDLATRLSVSRHRVLHMLIAAGMPAVIREAETTATAAQQLGLFDPEGGQS